MNELLKTFTYPRNAFSRTPERSAQKALQLLERVDLKKPNLDSSGSPKDEVFNDSKNFLATVSGPLSDPYVTEIGRSFENLAKESRAGAWQWLLTRSLWLYQIPNGTSSVASRVAQRQQLRFNLFDTTLRVAVNLSTLRHPENTLYFDEWLALMNDDSNWSKHSHILFHDLLESRKYIPQFETAERPGLLNQLEDKYKTGRDYLNTIYIKAFGQCGLFSVVRFGSTPVGIKLNSDVYKDPILGERLKFILDNPKNFTADIS